MSKVFEIQISVERLGDESESSETRFVVPSSVDTSEMSLEIRRMIERKYFPEICPDAENEI